jgi:Ala-tRNA(Pro) deacylase
MELRSYLDEHGAKYQWLSHPTAITSQELAQVEHTSGHNVAKPVVVKADDRFIMCVLPASRRVDLDQLRKELRAQQVALASEMQLHDVCEGCELGAEPPIGELFGLPTLIEQSLTADKEVLFQAGTHQEAVRMSFDEYRKLVGGSVAKFARPA